MKTKTWLAAGIGSILIIMGVAAVYAKNDGEKAEPAHEPHIAVCARGESDARCYARVIVDNSGVPKSATAPSGLSPAQFHVAYGLATSTAVRRIIGIVDAYDHPNILSDLNTYSQTFGIPPLPSCSGSVNSSPAPCFQKVNQAGGTKYPSSNASWALEIALDVESAHAMCQNCSILLVEANSANFSDLLTAEDRAALLGANVISNSWGGNEFSSESSATYDGHFNKPGVAIAVSAGDSGYGAEYPAASKYVTAVGGTSLLFNADNSYNSETAWSGTGSGCSAYESKPAWQADAQCSMRTIGDVSADADPNTGAAVYDSVRYQGQRGWFKVGGTSLSSPIIAAVYALASDITASSSASSLPYSNGNNLNLHDVLSGSNGSCGGSYLCTAGSGYDGPTGLGTPNGLGAF